MAEKVKIYLGRAKPNVTELLGGERVYLTKHDWACGWYWSLGWVGNAGTHTHFDSAFLNSSKVLYVASEIFEDPQISDADWWVLRDLFVQAYALKKVAEVYRYGGHQAHREGVTNLLKSEEKAAQVNADLALLLDTLWTHLKESVARQNEITKTEEA